MIPLWDRLRASKYYWVFEVAVVAVAVLSLAALAVFSIRNIVQEKRAEAMAEASATLKVLAVDSYEIEFPIPHDGLLVLVLEPRESGILDETDMTSVFLPKEAGNWRAFALIEREDTLLLYKGDVDDPEYILTLMTSADWIDPPLE